MKEKGIAKTAFWLLGTALLWLFLAPLAFSQALPVAVTEVDGSPYISAVSRIVFPNGSVTRNGSVATITIAGGGGAPTDATYITQTPNGTLSAEQALSTLSSGIMRVANATGVITSLTDSAGVAANISDETGTGVLVFGTSPTIATPRINQINDSNGNELIVFTTVASAVNELTHSNAATGNNPSTNPTGGDSNIGWTTTLKGTGSRIIVAGAAGGVPFIVDSAASPTANIAEFRQNTSSTIQFAVGRDGMFTYPGLKVLAADENRTTTTYSTVTGFSVPVRAGRTYALKAYITCSPSAAGGIKFRFSGTATMTDFGALYQIYNPATNALIASGGAAFNGDINEGLTPTSPTAAHLTIFGTFVVNAAGTFTMDAAQSTASGTSTVNKNATYMEIIEQQQMDWVAWLILLWISPEILRRIRRMRPRRQYQ